MPLNPAKRRSRTPVSLPPSRACSRKCFGIGACNVWLAGREMVVSGATKAHANDGGADPMKYLLATAMAFTLLAGGASAHPRPAGKPVGPMGWSALKGATGAAPEVMVGLGGISELGDPQGRDLRSSTRGNAEFPERSDAAQNLGNTSGGPAF